MDEHDPKNVGVLQATPSKDEYDKKDMAALNATPMRGDGYYALPDPSIILHDATLVKASEQGLLIPRSKEELNYSGDPLFSPKQNGRDIPVYQVNVEGMHGKPSDNFATIAPEAQLMKTAEGQEYILVNEAYQKRSAEEMRARMPSDAEINNLPVSGNMGSGGYQKTEALEAELKNNPAALKEFEDFKNHLTEEASVTGHKNITFIAAESKDIMGVTPVGEHVATAVVSKEGSEYIVVSRDKLDAALQSKEKMAELEGVRDHELTHIVRGDATPEGQALAHNNLAIARYEEAQGDLYGAVRSGHPDAMIKTFEEAAKKIAPGYQESPDHPVLSDRSEAVTLAGAAMQEYEKTHIVLTAGDREAEAQYVVPKVMPQMEGKWQLPMQAPDALEKNSQETKSAGEEKTSPPPKEGDHEKPGPQAAVGAAEKLPHGLNDSQMTAILAMRSMIGDMASLKMQNAETIAKNHSTPGKQPSQGGIAIQT